MSWRMMQVVAGTFLTRIAHSFQFLLSAGHLVAVADPAARDVLGSDWRAVTTALHASQSAHRGDSASTTWRIWAALCAQSGIRADLQDVPGDPVPVLLLFAHQYRVGCISSSNGAVRSRTAEDAVCHVAQTFTRLGAADPRLNSFGELDYRLHSLLRSGKKADPPPTRVKPLIMLVLRRAHQLADANLAISPRLFAAGVLAEEVPPPTQE